MKKTARTLSILVAGAMTLGAMAVQAGEQIVPGEEAAKQASKVNRDIKWNTSLEAAQDQARKQNKLIFWVHMLGHMDGAT